MLELCHQLIQKKAHSTPDKIALIYKKQAFSYYSLYQQVQFYGHLYGQAGLTPNQRVCCYLPKNPEQVIAFFASSYAGGVFVPINPVLKAPQALYILDNARATILVTQIDRLISLQTAGLDLTYLKQIILIDSEDNQKYQNLSPSIQQKCQFTQTTEITPPCSRIGTDMAAILYTSGSTGKPKGVVLSHQNLITGAQAVSSYLKNTADDRLLAVLPLSFDYGLNQITSAFYCGAQVVLIDYLLPNDVIKAIQKYQITGLAAVPPLWNLLINLKWSNEAIHSLRYITNSGGALSTTTSQALQTLLPNTKIFLMYGLTEAFRSSYLDPKELTKRPTSMGKAIPSAELLVINQQGKPCEPYEKGELVHRGALVAMGYWDNPEKTAKHFKPVPLHSTALALQEIAVWSGDQVYQDNEGFLFFVGRNDEMIKTSGYRVSPNEIEEVVFSSKLVTQAVVMGFPDPVIGQQIVLSVMPETVDIKQLTLYCRQNLANFMIPKLILSHQQLPKNNNGKLDRPRIYNEIKKQYFSEI